VIGTGVNGSLIDEARAAENEQRVREEAAARDDGVTKSGGLRVHGQRS
jgi:hypothetical protein